MTAAEDASCAETGGPTDSTRCTARDYRGAEHARSEVETALRRAAMAIPTGEVGAGSDTAKEWRREARETAPISVAQRMDDQPPEVEHGESREFSMEGASSGWCKSKERMEVRLRLREDGSEPPELELARYCALATWNAYEAAAGAGGQTTEGWALREAAMSIGVTRQGPHGPVLDASAVAAAEGEPGRASGGWKWSTGSCMQRRHTE